MSHFSNHNMKPCEHPHQVTFGDIHYTAEQINALLGMIPFKADRSEVPEMGKLSDANYVGHVANESILTNQQQPSWALVGSIKRARPFFYYVESFVPNGYQLGWNDLSEVLGTYDLTADKVSIFDFNLVTEYNVSRNHQNIKRDFSSDWGLSKFYYPEYDTYNPCKVYNEGDRANMPDYTENTFIALRETSQPPFITIEVSSEFTLGEAVAITPEQYRYPGIRLTFVNSKTHQAETWFWLGSEWEDENNWIKPSGNVAINNLPDEEDISVTKESIPRLQLKDKLHDRNSYSGLGRCYLRKNMVDGVNVLTQAMFTNEDGSVKSNTRYIIQYDYDLNGDTIEVPAGCVLEFQGGSLDNGTIVGNLTKFKNLIDDTLLCDFGGTFKDMSIKASYLGLHPEGDGNVASTPNQMVDFLRLNNLIRGIENVVVEFNFGYYGFGGGDKKAQLKSMSVSTVWNGWFPFCIEGKGGAVTKNLTIKGNNSKFINVYGYYIGGWYLNSGVMTPTSEATTGWAYNTYGGGCIFVNKEDINIHLDGVYIDMKEQETFRYGGKYAYSTNNCPVYIRACNNCYIEHSYLANSTYECLLLSKADTIVIQDTTFDTGRRHNIAFGQYNTCNLLNIKTINGGVPRTIENSQYRFERSGHDIDFEGEHAGKYAFGDLTIDGHICVDACNRIYVSGTYMHKNIDIRNVSIISTKPSVDYVDDGLTIDVTSEDQIVGPIYATESFKLNNIYIQDKIPFFGCIRRPDAANPDNNEWYYQTPPTPVIADNIIFETKFLGIGSDSTLVHLQPAFPFNYKWNSATSSWEYKEFMLKSTFNSSGAPCYASVIEFNNLTMKVNNKVVIGIMTEVYTVGISINNLTIHLLEPTTKNPIYKAGMQFGNVNVLNIVDHTMKPTLGTSLVNTTMYGAARKYNIYKLGDYYGFKLTQAMHANTEYISYHVLNDGGYVTDNVIFQKEYNSPNCRTAITVGGYNKAYIGNPHSVIHKVVNCDNTLGVTNDCVTYTSSLLKQKGNILLQLMKKTGVDESGNYVYDRYYAGVLKGLKSNIYDSKSAIDGTPVVGECIYLKDVAKPAWWTGSKWVDATGTEIV